MQSIQCPHFDAERRVSCSDHASQDTFSKGEQAFRMGRHIAHRSMISLAASLGVWESEPTDEGTKRP
jgi:hypothetical protein